MTSDFLTARKSDLRESARAVRRMASQNTPGGARIAGAHALRAIARIRHIRTVSAYVAFREEIDPKPLMHSLHGLGINVALPVIEEARTPLRFRRWQPGVRMVPGKLGILIPEEGDATEPDALIVPLLAFDSRGHRLGYGGGYYDRTIADLRARSKILTIGFAYAAQEVEELPDGLHDVPLDGIATERGFVAVRL
jgi:5-formyltetrahydrofolate cyclo-ligase